MKWTQEQNKWLIENYSIYGPEETCALLNITKRQLSHKLSNCKKHNIILLYKPYNSHSKKCLTCGEWKTFDNFFNDPNGRCGKHAFCKDCYNSKQKYRYANDIDFRVLRLIRRRFRTMFQKKEFTINAEIILGCTTTEIIKHIESQFNSNISWENQSLWDIDHIIPVSVLRKNPEKLHLVFNYRNHQPLLKKENISKNDNLCKARLHLEEKIRKFGIDPVYQEMLDLLDDLT
jgi:hypothetical protein